MHSDHVPIIGPLLIEFFTLFHFFTYRIFQFPSCPVSAKVLTTQSNWGSFSWKRFSLRNVTWIECFCLFQSNCNLSLHFLHHFIPIKICVVFWLRWAIVKFDYDENIEKITIEWIWKLPLLYINNFSIQFNFK